MAISNKDINNLSIYIQYALQMKFNAKSIFIFKRFITFYKW